MYGNRLPIPSGTADPNDSGNSQANGSNMQNFGVMGPPPPNWGMATVIQHPNCYTMLQHQHNSAPIGNYGQNSWPIQGQWGPMPQVHSGYGVPAIMTTPQYGMFPHPVIPPPRPPPLCDRAEMPAKQPGKKKPFKSQQKGPRLYRSKDDVDREKREIEHEQMNCVAVQKPKTKEELEEVLRWLEDRRRNFPTKANMKRKAEEAKLMEARGEPNPKQKTLSLQDIVRKQREMGLDKIAGTNSMFSGRGKGGNRGRSQARGGPRLRGKRCFDNKEGMSEVGERKIQQNKRQKPHVQICRRAPSLVEKLLCKDIQKDKSQILQCIRFLVENDFLQNLGKIPLIYHDSHPHQPEKVDQEPNSMLEETLVCTASGTSESDTDDRSTGEGITSSSLEEGEV